MNWSVCEARLPQSYCKELYQNHGMSILYIFIALEINILYRNADIVYTDTYTLTYLLSYLIHGAESFLRS